MFKSKHYLLAFILLTMLLTTKIVWAAETKPLNAGFVNTLWYSSTDFVVGEKVRIYSAIQNQSPFDLVGEVKLFDNDKEIQKNSVAIASGNLIHHWFDFTITTGTHQMYEVLRNTKISNVSSTTEIALIQSPTSTVIQKISTTKPTPLNSLATTTPFSSETITVSSDAQALIKNSAPPSSTGATLSTTSIIMSKTTSQTKNFILNLTGGLVENLKKQKNLLDEDIKKNTNMEPLPVLEDAAREMEKKTTFLKIPREKIPSFENIQSWSLALSIYILQTWWLVLLILLLVLRGIWKILSFFRKKDRY